MGDLVEERIMRKGRDRADRDLSAPLRVTLDVAVQVLKLDSLDIQRLKGLLFVPSRDDGHLSRAPPVMPCCPRPRHSEQSEESPWVVLAALPNEADGAQSAFGNRRSAIGWVVARVRHR